MRAVHIENGTFGQKNPFQYAYYCRSPPEMCDLHLYWTHVVTK